MEKYITKRTLSLKFLNTPCLCDAVAICVYKYEYVNNFTDKLQIRIRYFPLTIVKNMFT